MSAEVRGSTKNYMIEDGLQDLYIECIAQDSTGFIWVGSKSGIARFESGQFVAGRIETATPHGFGSRPINRRVYSALLDRSKQLWLGTDGDGLLKYDYEKHIFRRVLTQDTVSHLIVRKIVEGKDSTLWIATPYYAGKISADGTVAWYPLRQQGSNCYINALLCAEDGTMWAGSRENGLYQFDPLTQQFAPYHYISENEVFKGSILSLLDTKHGLLAGTEKAGLHVIDCSARRAVQYRSTAGTDILGSDEIFTLFKNKQSQILIGTINGGMSVMNAPSGVVTKHQISSIENVATVSCFYDDNDGNLWIGTHAKGIILVGQDNDAFQQHFLTVPSGKKLSEMAVTSLHVDRSGNIWAGTDGDGLFVRTAGAQRYAAISAQTGLTSKVILDIEEMPDGSLWLATWGDGIAIYDPIKQKVRYERSTKPHSVNYDNIKSIYFDGSICWISTHGGGINIFDWNKQSFVTGSYGGLSLSDCRIPLWGNVSTRDQQGNIWFGTTTGLFRYDGAKMHSYLFSPEDSTSVPSNYIADISCGDDGTVWIGTLGGLCSYLPAKNSFRRTSAAPLVSPIYRIVSHRNDTLTIMTPVSIIRYSPQAGTASVYNSLDNMYIDNFTERAAAIDSSGTVHIGGIGTILSVQDGGLSKKMKLSLLPVSLYLNNKLIDPHTANAYLHRQLFLTDTVQIDHTQSLIRIDYLCLDPLAKEYLTYRYMMEGFDRVWNNAGSQTSALYSNLPYGDYTFVVQALDAQGNVLSESKRIRIEVLPPWWATLWFKTLLIFLCISAILGAIYLRLSLLTQRKAELEAEVARRTSELMHSYEQLSRSQQALLDQNDELQENHEMSAARMHALRESLKTKDQLIAIIAHDLKNPIGAASGMVSLLNGFFEHGNKDKFVTFQSHIQNSMKSMQNLVDSMTDWSLCEAGQLKYSPAEIAIDHSVREVLSLVAPSAEKKNITIEYSSALERYVYADQRMVSTILRNLIQNAIKFTPPSGQIRISITEQDGYARCCVSDSGMGISPQLCEALATGKTIIPRQGTDNEKGIGLGLQTCRKFINFCKGEFLIESTLDKGSDFSFTLPLSDSMISDPSLEREAPDANLQEIAEVEIAEDKIEIPRLIIVDDNPQILELLAESFHEGYEVLVFEKPEHALQCALKMIPDIIVSDVMMPEMDGTEFCRRIKSNAITQHIPLIFLTSQSSVSAEVEGLKAGADDYMAKPFDIRILKAKIQSLLFNRQRLRATMEKDGMNAIEEQTDPFMIEFQALVEANVDNYHLSVEFIADKMHYSKSQIYRKCLALTGIAPAEYIREHKLQLAAQLLRLKDKQISEIAFDLGFSDPQYFSKVFIKKYGVSPKNTGTRNYK